MEKRRRRGDARQCKLVGEKTILRLSGGGGTTGGGGVEQLLGGGGVVEQEEKLHTHHSVQTGCHLAWHSLDQILQQPLPPANC